MPLLVVVEPYVLQSKDLLLGKVGANLHCPCGRSVGPIKHPFLLASLHTLIDVITTKPKVTQSVVVGPKLFLHSSVCWCRSAMCGLTNFGLARMSCVCLQSPTLFLGWIKQPRNMPMGVWTFQLQHTCNVGHSIVNMLQ